MNMKQFTAAENTTPNLLASSGLCCFSDSASHSSGLIIAAVRFHERIHRRIKPARKVVAAGAGAMHTDQVSAVTAAGAARVSVVVERRSALAAAGVSLVLDGGRG